MFVGCIVKVTMRKQQKFAHSRMCGVRDCEHNYLNFSCYNSGVRNKKT